MLGIFAFILLSVFSANAEPFNLGEPHQSLAVQANELVQKGSTPFSELHPIILKWKEKCEHSTINVACYLNECDLKPGQDCDPDSIFLFRGQETGENEETYPALSGLALSRWKGSHFAETQDAQAMLNALKLNFQTMGSVSRAPYEQSLTLVQNLSNSVWNDHHGKRFQPDFDLKTILNFKQFLYAFHVQASSLYYFDSIKNSVFSIDPVISFSEDPEVALSFATHSQQGEEKQFTRLIMLRVPRSEMKSISDESIPVPGEIWNPHAGGEGLSSHPFERENDAIMYIHPQYIWKVFAGYL